jgi:PAS domain S-box-containing protein
MENLTAKTELDIVRRNEAAPVPVLVIDARGRIVFLNKAAQGFLRADLTDASIADVLDEHEAARVLSEDLRQREMEFLGENGAILWGEVSSREIGDGLRELFIFDTTERRSELRQLTREKGFAEAAVNSMPGIFYLIDANGHFLRWNDNFRSVSGYTDAEIARMHLTEFFPEEDRAHIIERIKLAFEAGASSAQRDFLSKNGTRTPYYFTGSLIDYHEQPCLVGMGIDISKRLELEKESLKLASIVESSSDAIIGLDLDGRVESWNEGACVLYGYNAAEMIGRPASDLIPSDRRREEREIFERIRIGKRTRHYETIRLKKDGSFVPVSLTISPIVDNDGSIIGASKIARDITPRKRTEQALRDSEQRYRAFVKHSTEGIWRFEIKDPIATDTSLTVQMDHIFENGYLAETNFAIAQQYGLTDVDDMIGAEIKELMPPGEVSNVDLMEFFVGNDYQAHSFETGMVDDHGNDRYFLNNLTGIIEDGKLTRIWGTREDITASKEAERAYKISEDQLRQSQKVEALGRLAGGIAHDFNNFLAVIMLHVDMLNLQLQVDSPLRYRMSEIKSVTNNAAVMVKQLLAYGRKQTMQPHPTQLNQVITEYLKIIKPLIGENIEVDLSLSPELGVCFVDPNQMTQVLMNLAVNSRDAMPGGGVLKFETFNTEITEKTRIHKAQPAGSYIQMNVTDSGIGMDEVTQSRIFEPFFTSKDAGKGTGLGLSTVYGIVKQSHGFIWVDSEPGQGTKFRLFFPRIDQPAISVKSEPVERTFEAMPQGTETILVVEDEDQIRRAAVEVLTVLGYQVFEAANGAQALQMSTYFVQPIHLLLTDVIMPKMNGQELAEQLRELHPETSVLFMSGYTGDIINREGILEEDMNFLGKPFTPLMLAVKIREVLDTEQR